VGEVIVDRLVRYSEWVSSVETPVGRERFLSECARVGDVGEVCRELDLPRGRVVAFLAQNAEMDQAVNRALKRYGDELVSEAKEVADASGAAGLIVKTNLKIAGYYNERYRESVEVKHSGVVTFSAALQQIAERRMKTIGSGSTQDVVAEANDACQI
jgi:hypothetical protein